MPWVRLTPEALRYFDALPSRLQEAVLNLLTDLEVDPEERGQPLLGRLRGLWSARVGSYRVIYSMEGSGRSREVTIHASKHRSHAHR